MLKTIPARISVATPLSPSLNATFGQSGILPVSRSDTTNVNKSGMMRVILTSSPPPLKKTVVRTTTEIVGRKRFVRRFVMVFFELPKPISYKLGVSSSLPLGLPTQPTQISSTSHALSTLVMRVISLARVVVQNKKTSRPGIMIC